MGKFLQNAAKLNIEKRGTRETMIIIGPTNGLYNSFLVQYIWTMVIHL